MNIKVLKKFPDKKLLDELIIEECDLEFRKSGKARYQLCMKSEKNEYAVKIWTSQKGLIDTRIESDDVNSCFIYSLDSSGNVEQLSCHCNSIHLEHMDRGYYWLGLASAGSKLSIHFTTNGYLKSDFNER